MNGHRELRLEAPSATDAAVRLSADGRSWLLSALSASTGRWFD
ncbi:hypothetical protein ACQP1P_10370 [Dactylosporangium sp. CA-052675]